MPTLLNFCGNKTIKSMHLDKLQSLPLNHNLAGPAVHGGGVDPLNLSLAAPN